MRTISEEEPSIVLKVLVVGIYTGIGTALASAKLVTNPPAGMNINLELPAWLLLGMVMALAITLSLKGRQSESWAVIAYGSLSVGFLKCFAMVMWFAWDLLQKNWLGAACIALPCIGLVAWGLCAAVQKRWQRMLGVSLLMFVGVNLNYASYFYSARHPIPPLGETMRSMKEKR